jgi:alkanesulfonate monooxygenase SsuD/methylene tetrahydromethanopterin reductase-like flavin-dependent oxidoreductase (luciferase family)
MRVFVFDLLPYGENLEYLKSGAIELPWPLPKEHFKPEVAVRTYAEHLEAWDELDRLGFDGVGFNEHHTSPYGLMNSPNLLAASAAQRTKHLKLLIYGNLLPIHEPLRLAEELAMLDCLSNGRIISGFARGIPREHNVYSVPQSESRQRFEEAWEIIRGAWTDEVFSYTGRFWSYKDIALWPRPVQQPHPPVWVPVTASKETIEWAARHNIPITPGLSSHRGLREDVIGFYARELARHGHRITPDHLVIQNDVYIADTKQQAVEEAGPYALYFNRTLFSHGNITERGLQAQVGYVSSASHDYLRPEHVPLVSGNRERYRGMTMDGIRQLAQDLPWGPPDEVVERIISAADHAGANQITVTLNRGAMPHAMFLEQIHRFARYVLPRLQAHEVTRVPIAERALAHA